jgi:hypothetical protein
MRHKKSLSARDQAVSSFSGTLMQLCDDTAAYGAALVDAEGETVDYAGYLDPFEIRVAAAEWRLVFQSACEAKSSLGVVTRLLFRGLHKSYAVYAISDGYALVIQTAHRSLLPSSRAVAEAVRALALEAGLGLDDNSEFRHERWHRVEVRFERDRRRPTDVWHRGAWVPIEVLGRYAEAPRSRRLTGYRALLPDGSELTLVREPMGAWYADDLPQPTSMRRDSSVSSGVG